MNKNAVLFFQDLPKEHLVAENQYFALYDTVNTKAWGAYKDYNGFVVNKMRNSVEFFNLQPGDKELLAKQIENNQDFMDYADIEFMEYDLDLEK